MLQESTGFSLFDLLYGRKVSGPLDVLWKAQIGEDGKEIAIATHIVEVKDCLQDLADMVKGKMGKTPVKQKSHYDHHTRGCHIKERDQVLVLLGKASSTWIESSTNFVLPKVVLNTLKAAC